MKKNQESGEKKCVRKKCMRMIRFGTVSVHFLRLLHPAVDVERVVRGLEIVQLTGRFYDLLDAGVTEFQYMPGIEIDQVIMLHAPVSFFKLGNVLAELVFDHQVAIEQQFNGIVQGSPADAVIFILHENIKRFNIEVSVPRVYFIQNGVAFRSFPVAFLFQVFRKYLLYRFLCFHTTHNLVQIKIAF